MKKLNKSIFLFILLLPLLIGCNRVVPSVHLPATQTLQEQPGSNQGEKCPITPPKNKFSMAGSVAGQDPIWISSSGEVKWSDMVVSLPPYPGRLTKMLVFVSRNVEGDLEITGRQIASNEKVLFALDGQEKVDSKGLVIGSIVNDPKDTWIVHSANQPSRYPNPDGYVHHGEFVYFPSPGCYELSAKIDQHEVKVVVDLVQ